MGGPGSGKSSKPITRTRPKATWHCHWQPRRVIPRSFTTNDAARVICACVKSGRGTIRSIAVAAEKRCPDAARPGGETEAGAVAEAVAAFQATDILLNDAYEMFVIINSVLLGV